jgi:molybdate transport system permease protein
LIVVFGIPLAFAISQDIFKRRRLVDTIIDLPLVLPPAVAGVALLLTFGRGGIIGAYLADLGMRITFTPLAVILAQVFVSAPFFIKSAVSGFSSIDLEIEQSAGIDGANVWHLLRFIMLPLSWSALLSGAAMSWARALGEFGATIIFAGNLPGVTQTMPLAIYLGFQIDMQIAVTLSVILVSLSFLVLLLVKGLLSRDLP